MRKEGGIEREGEREVVWGSTLTVAAVGCRINTGQIMLDAGNNENCTSGKYGTEYGSVCHYWWYVFTFSRSLLAGSWIRLMSEKGVILGATSRRSQ